MLKVTRSQLPDSRLISSLVPMPLLKAALLTAVMGWLILQGQRAGIYDTALAVSLVALVSTVAFAVSTLQSAETLERIDADRQRASQALGQSEERYRAFVEQSTLLVLEFPDIPRQYPTIPDNPIKKHNNSSNIQGIGKTEKRAIVDEVCAIVRSHVPRLPD